MQITAQEVISGIEKKNNTIAGGGYIEKVNQAFSLFVRRTNYLRVDDIKKIRGD